MSIYDEFDIFSGITDTSGSRFGSQSKATLSEQQERDEVDAAAETLKESRARYRSMGRIPPLGRVLMKRLRLRATAPEDEDRTEAAVTSTANVGAYPVPVGGALRRSSPASVGSMGQDVVPAYSDDEEDADPLADMLRLLRKA